MESIPNATPFDSPTYSGFLKVSDTKQLHYTFSASLQATYKTDPVVIWFNGGPGCSSMLGFMQENGPRVIEDHATDITVNPYPWNNATNMLWLESPAGVGWSTADDPQDLKTNDLLSGQDNFAALLAWYEKFPEYKENALYISGESYAGLYVPYLAYQVYQNNLIAEFTPSLWHIPLNGTMVGNGCTDWTVDSWQPYLETVYNFNMVPKWLYDYYYKNHCVEYCYGLFESSTSPECLDAIDKIQVLTLDRINYYDLYSTDVDPDDIGMKGKSRYGTTMINGQEKKYKRGYTRSEYTPWAPHIKKSENEPIFGDTVSDYMNLQETRTAFNIPDNNTQPWAACSDDVDYYASQQGSLWIYEVLHKSDIRMMFYSGDTDGAVPIAGSRQWIKKLNRAVVEAWRPWYTDEQVSGYIERYDNFDFVTVKGTGHMAPQWKRKQVTQMITNWIQNKPI